MVKTIIRVEPGERWIGVNGRVIPLDFPVSAAQVWPDREVVVVLEQQGAKEYLHLLKFDGVELALIPPPQDFKFRYIGYHEAVGPIVSCEYIGMGDSEDWNFLIDLPRKSLKPWSPFR